MDAISDTASITGIWIRNQSTGQFSEYSDGEIPDWILPLEPDWSRTICNLQENRGRNEALRIIRFGTYPRRLKCPWGKREIHFPTIFRRRMEYYFRQDELPPSTLEVLLQTLDHSVLPNQTLEIMIFHASPIPPFLREDSYKYSLTCYRIQIRNQGIWKYLGVHRPELAFIRLQGIYQETGFPDAGGEF